MEKPAVSSMLMTSPRLETFLSTAYSSFFSVMVRRRDISLLPVWKRLSELSKMIST